VGKLVKWLVEWILATLLDIFQTLHDWLMRPIYDFYCGEDERAGNLIPVSAKLPDYTDFVWVKREASEVLELAFSNGSWGFQNPYTVGDSEGLSVEYYSDVTHWAELQAPASLGQGVR